MSAQAGISTRKLQWGAILWIVAVVQYAVAQFVVAAAWTSPYSVTANFISDLGNTRCGEFAVPHGQPAYVCSPQHWVMNGSFILSGILGGIGILLLRTLWPRRRAVAVGVAFWLAAAVGKIIVGLVPENTNISLHTLGALNIPLGSIAILLLGRSVYRNTGGSLHLAGIGLACLGLIGTILSVAGQYSGTNAYLGLGAGGTERLASYPGSLWMLLVGILVLAIPLTTVPPRTSTDTPAPTGAPLRSA